MSYIKEKEPPEKGGSKSPTCEDGSDPPEYQAKSESIGQQGKQDSLKCETESSFCKVDIDCLKSNKVNPEESHIDIDVNESETKDGIPQNKEDDEILQSQVSQEPQKRKRKWEVFPGGNKFHCNGRCIRAPEYIGYLVSLTLLVITGVLFFGSDCVYLTKKVGVVIPALGAPLFLFIFILFHRTAFSDPGIIPRATPDEIESQEPGYIPVDKNEPRYIKTEIKGRVFNLPYCSTCKLYRPPRASHCSTCDNCVSKFDHHCPVVSNCIGARNYKYYYLLVISLTVMSCYVIGCNVAVICLRAEELGTSQAFLHSIPSLIESFISFGCLVTGLVCLAGIHSILICREQTTHEMIRGTFNKKVFENNLNPYSHGRWYLNCLHTLCSPSPPSLIDRRGYVSAEVSDIDNARPKSPV